MVKNAPFGHPGYIAVFDRFASGDAALLRTFTDVDSSFIDAQSIALGQADLSPLRPTLLRPHALRSTPRRTLPPRRAR
jgi:hypothetical protein